MTKRTQGLSAAFALCALLPGMIRAGQAQQVTPRPQAQDSIGPSNGQITAALVGIVGIGVAIGVGVTLAIKHGNHSVTGCAHSGPGGLVLTSDSDKRNYTLMGEVAAIKPEHRVHLSGKKGKEKSGGGHDFLVEKVAKDFGACEVAGGGH